MSKKKKLKPQDKKEIIHLIYLTECDGELAYFNAWTQSEIDDYANRHQIYSGGNYIIVKGGNVVEQSF